MDSVASALRKLLLLTQPQAMMHVTISTDLLKLVRFLCVTMYSKWIISFAYFWCLKSFQALANVSSSRFDAGSINSASAAVETPAEDRDGG